MKKKLLYLLLLIFFVHLGYRIFTYGDEFTKPFDADYWEYRYLHSQWVDPNSQESIGDDGLYAYAGYQYIHGAIPTLINPEVPPLGKYLIGLSIVIFQNQNIFALAVGLLTLFVFFKLNSAIFNNSFLSFLPVFVFSLEPIFYEQLRAPYLDLLQLLFVMLTLLFIFRKKYLLSAVFIACMAGTKFSFLAVLLVFAIVIYLALKKNGKEIRQFLVSLPLALILFISFYLRFFMLGNSFLDFLRVQKFIIHFYDIGAKAHYGIIYPMIVLGDWYTWYAGKIRVNEWNVLWPIGFILTIISIIVLVKERKSTKSSLFALWVVVYLLFLSFIPTSPRYLLLLLPFMYNLSVWVFSKSMRHILLFLPSFSRFS